MNFESIVQEEAKLAMDRGVLFGAAGAVAGVMLARQWNMSAPAGAATVLASHFAAHSLAKM